MGELEAESLRQSALTEAGGQRGGRRGVLARFASLLPVTSATPDLTLLEGDTPLLRTPRLAQWVGVDELWVKFEGMNPTGSFKDRGMVVAVAKAAERGVDTVLCASTGNTAASAAAYAARAGLRAVVLLPRGGVAGAKVSQALAYGARAVIVDGNFDGALDVARQLTDRRPMELVNSVNPHRIAGQATAAYEICDTLGGAPDLLALPVGNGGNISAYWAGFRRYHCDGRIDHLPVILGAQAAGAAPLVRGRPIEHPDTIASAIRIGRPASWHTAVAAAHESGERSCPSRTTRSSRPTAKSDGSRAFSANQPPPRALPDSGAVSLTGPRRPRNAAYACVPVMDSRTRSTRRNWTSARPSSPQPSTQSNSRSGARREEKGVRRKETTTACSAA